MCLLVASLAVGSSLSWATDLAWDNTPGGAPTPGVAQACAPTPAARACWASMPVLLSPHGMLIQFEDDLPSQGWQMAVNLDTPTPLDMSVFTRLPGMDELPTREAASDRQRKLDDGEDGAVENTADSWGYELLVLLGLGVLAILASRLRRGRRGKRRDVSGHNKVRTRRRVRLDTRL